jgi:hypothetical protein
LKPLMSVLRPLSGSNDQTASLSFRFAFSVRTWFLCSAVHFNINANFNHYDIEAAMLSFQLWQVAGSSHKEGEWVEGKFFWSLSPPR